MPARCSRAVGERACASGHGGRVRQDRSYPKQWRQLSTILFLVLMSLAPAIPAERGHSASGTAGQTPGEALDADHAYDTPAPGLSADQREQFLRGRQVVRERWVVAPSPFGSWGRGPTSNGEACVDCHPRNGRGVPPEAPGETAVSAILRLSLPGISATGAAPPHPRYGSQLQHLGILGQVPAEGEFTVQWRETVRRYPDGDIVWLRFPQIGTRALAFGTLEPETAMSMRVAPPLAGLGLLEAVAESWLEQRAAISGRLNRVRDSLTGQRRTGRFGWKATQPDLRTHAAHAFFEDLGITSDVHRGQNCTDVQDACRAAAQGTQPEISSDRLDAVAFYLRALDAPAAGPSDSADTLRGALLFESAGCGTCHAGEAPLGDSPLAAVTGRTVIRPYTDLLLHDMGEDLADGVREYLAGASDWRTAPLWGIGMAKAVTPRARYLHDGRARSLEEAILWHGGEARSSRQRFEHFARDDRHALLAFLRSL